MDMRCSSCGGGCRPKLCFWRGPSIIFGGDGDPRARRAEVNQCIDLRRLSGSHCLLWVRTVLANACTRPAGIPSQNNLHSTAPKPISTMSSSIVSSQSPHLCINVELSHPSDPAFNAEGDTTPASLVRRWPRARVLTLDHHGHPPFSPGSLPYRTWRHTKCGRRLQGGRGPTSKTRLE